MQLVVDPEAVKFTINRKGITIAKRRAVIEIDGFIGQIDMGVTRVLTKFELVGNLVGKRVTDIGFFGVEIVEVRFPKECIAAGFDPDRIAIAKAAVAFAVTCQKGNFGACLGLVGKGGAI